MKYYLKEDNQPHSETDIFNTLSLRDWKESRIILTSKRRAKCAKFVLGNDFLNNFRPDFFIAFAVK